LFEESGFSAIMKASASSAVLLQVSLAALLDHALCALVFRLITTQTGAHGRWVPLSPRPKIEKIREKIPVLEKSAEVLQLLLWSTVCNRRCY
jgi:tRNA C32,U32 (ribose-2'-O)-methylase TrmJ